ncbi:MAG: LexA family transcriptional regulator [Candidatus Omnitrophica bacterium]|nr:LexA family transcriptional regulator [Candidatus Omnitrophota bacterium]
MRDRKDLIRQAKEINLFYSDHKRMPSYSEMLKLFRLRSKNAVFKRVLSLVREGFLDKDSKGRIVPGRLLKPTRVLGVIAAGFPSPAEEELVDTMSLDEYLISNPQATYILKVDGDSMIDAGIHPGDLILTQRNIAPKTGDIVVAQVDGEWTLKYFEKRGKIAVLKSANRKYPTIMPKQELIIAGVVIANVRKYR